MCLSILKTSFFAGALLYEYLTTAGEKNGRFCLYTTQRTLTVVVPKHWLVSAVRQTLVPYRNLSSLVGDEDHVQLSITSLGPVEQVAAQAHRVFFAVVRGVPAAICPRAFLTQMIA